MYSTVAQRQTPPMIMSPCCAPVAAGPMSDDDALRRPGSGARREVKIMSYLFSSSGEENGESYRARADRRPSAI
jgi:hypothetical protein